jgi:hypothetical protein
MTINRKRVARGAKVVKQHLESSVGAVAAALSSAAFEPQDLAESKGVTRLNLHIPAIDSGFFATYAASSQDGNLRLAIPFCFPQFQQQFRSDGLPRPGDPDLVLDAISMSFDQRGEAVAICDQNEGVGAEGKMAFDAVGQLGLTVALLSKPQQFFQPTAGFVPNTEVVSFELPAESFSGPYLRQSPFVLSGIGQTISNYRTYMLVLSVPDLAGARNVALPSFTISLRLLSIKAARDQGSASTIQNIPSPWVGDRVTKATSQTAIAGDDPVTQANLHTNIENVDKTFRRRLEGGYMQEGVPPVWDEINADSCYEVIAVPMWGNFGSLRRVLALSAGLQELPFGGANPVTSPTCDRRIVGLHFPFVLHHTVICANYQSPIGPGVAAAGLLPASATMHNSVGVGLLQGKEGDDFGYQQLAYASWTPATKANIKIDYAKAHPNTLTTASDHDLELLQCSLVGSGGSGYYAQGRPIFCGRTKAGAASRVNVGGAASSVLGRETHIEVRWEMKDAAAGLAGTTHGGAIPDQTVFAGFGGHWVLLCGKKGVVGNENDVQV